MAKIHFCATSALEKGGKFLVYKNEYSGTQQRVRRIIVSRRCQMTCVR